MTNEDPRILELRKMRAKALEGGGEERNAKQRAKGKLTARERVELLLDPGTFNEIEPFITHQGDEMDLLKEKFYGDGVITGYGQINGRTVYLYSQDFTIYGGTLSEMQSHKICRVMDLAVRNGVPFISLIDSGGARIQEGVRSMGGYAEIFRRNAQYSGVVPQVSVMLGPCAGGAAYSPALTDMVIMVEKSSFMFLTGPDVIKAVTGEVIDAESLGGANVHTSVSGVAHVSVQSEKAALEMARHFLSYLPSNNVENPPYVQPTDSLSRMNEELNHMIPLEAT
ncbi:MAG: methylmalonyl-CoA carboxyltransferase, partial [Anaerolineales bacterium]|nr:methylmalonyl-CoA carboxyltransferase [Anaerolineales bacterium]